MNTQVVETLLWHFTQPPERNSIGAQMARLGFKVKTELQSVKRLLTNFNRLGQFVISR